MIRLFAAIAVPEEIARGLVPRQRGLAEARWRPAEAFHITLRFFGETPEPLADDIDLALSRVSGGPLAVELAGAGTFGEGAAARAAWAGVAPNPALERLARRVEAAARRAGCEPDARAWRPHVTLAYLRRPDPARVAAWLQANSLLASPPFRVDAFGLYSSRRAGEGSVYRLERRYALV